MPTGGEKNFCSGLAIRSFCRNIEEITWSVPPNSGSLRHHDLEKCHVKMSNWNDEILHRKLGKKLTERAAQQAGGSTGTSYQENWSSRVLDNVDGYFCDRKNLI